MRMERFGSGDLGETELSLELKLKVGKYLGWIILIDVLFLFNFLFSSHYLGMYGEYYGKSFYCL